jgi:hypothetical protein
MNALLVDKLLSYFTGTLNEKRYESKKEKSKLHFASTDLNID